MFKGCLEEMGFTLNLYDPCVANKDINGQQCKICWYVDNTKISHADSKVVDTVIKNIKAKVGKMTVARGNIHTFVGVDIEFIGDGSVSLLMNDYTDKCIKMYQHEIKSKATTPVKGDLFEEDSNELVKLLDEIKDNKCHHTTAKLSYLSKCARLDIDLAVSFLCTRVLSPTAGDEEKLKKVLAYLQGTRKMNRFIGMNGLSYLQTWIDASYAVHRDMRGHTGGVISLGRGAVIHNCSKQKINTKSSTKSEVVGASDFLLYTILALYFLKAQGCKLNRNIFYQDDTGAIVKKW